MIANTTASKMANTTPRITGNGVSFSATVGALLLTITIAASLVVEGDDDRGSIMFVSVDSTGLAIVMKLISDGFDIGSLAVDAELDDVDDDDDDVTDVTDVLDGADADVVDVDVAVDDLVVEILVVGNVPGDTNSSVINHLLMQKLLWYCPRNENGRLVMTGLLKL